MRSTSPCRSCDVEAIIRHGHDLEARSFFLEYHVCETKKITVGMKCFESSAPTEAPKTRIGAIR